MKNNKKIFAITLLVAVFSFCFMLIMFLSAYYFKQVLNSENISVFYVAVSILIIPLLLNLHKFFFTFGRIKVFVFLNIFSILLLSLLTFLKITFFSAFVLVLYIIALNVLMVVWDAVLEEYSQDKDTGRIRGLFLSFWNLGGMLGPLAGGVILSRYGYNFAFLVSIFLYFLILICFLFVFNNVKIKEKKVESITKVLRLMRRDRDIWNIYWISTILKIFYAVGTIFFSLYLVSIGLSVAQVGFIFTVTFLPFVLLEYKIGVWADKKYGEKEMLIIGFVIMIIAMIFIFFTKSNSFYLWMFLLTLAFLGATFVEAMSDTYFYKKIDSSEIVISNFFRSSRPLSYLVGALIGGIIQVQFNFKGVFLATIISLLIGGYFAIILRDIDPKKQDGI